MQSDQPAQQIATGLGDPRELVTTAQMRAAEAFAIESGTSGERLMERAGRKVADAVCRLFDCSAGGFRPPDNPEIHILCGPGNNGGDGYVIARVLKDRGFQVTVYGLAPVAKLSGDARRMAERWNGPVHPPRRFLGLSGQNLVADQPSPASGRRCRQADEGVSLTRPPLRSATLSRERERGCSPVIIIDALFGTGLARAVEGEAAKLIAHANSLPGWKIAVDIPSGIGSDTGAVMGIAFEADLTVTFHAMKPGHVLPPGARHCGAVEIADIGLGPQATTRARLTTDGPEIDLNDGAALLAPLGTDPDAHKYTKGHTLILAGGIEGVGAARLAARAALRAGAGLVTIGCPPSALMAHASRGPDALMIRRCDGADGLAALLEDQRRNAVVIGPAFGVGEATRATVATVLRSGRPAVLDADALTSFENHLEELAELTRRAGNTVLTPHSGEFARLFSPSRTKPMPRKGKMAVVTTENGTEEGTFSNTSVLHKALAAAAELTAVIVLKGPATVIAAPDGRAAINVNAPPWLGTAGSGDVLAGIIGGLLSQGLSPFDAARAGVWLHGEAGQIAGRGLIADDLPEAVRRYWRKRDRE